MKLSARANVWGMFIIAQILLAGLCNTAHADVAVPKTPAPITDLTNTLSAEQIATLDKKLRDYKASKGIELTVLVLPTTEPEAIEQYALRVAEAWKLGREGPDDAALLVIAKEDHAARIEVGQGLEGAIPDVIAARVIREVLAPHFRLNQFYEGITEAIDRMVALTQGEALPPPPAQGERVSRRGSNGIGSILPIVLIAALGGGSILRSLFGRAGGSLLTGLAVGVVAWLIVSTVAGVFAGLLAFVVTLFGGGGGGFSSFPRGGGWGGGFGGGGGGFGGGGGGSWGGGGGGFSGGGASGRW